MVGACQQNSGIFLVRGGGAGQEICGVRRRARSDIPAGAEAGQAADRCWTGGGTSRDRVGGSQINSKENAL